MDDGVISKNGKEVLKEKTKDKDTFLKTNSKKNQSQQSLLPPVVHSLSQITSLPHHHVNQNESHFQSGVEKGFRSIFV
jgi:hypothetical protein